MFINEVEFWVCWRAGCSFHKLLLQIHKIPHIERSASVYNRIFRKFHVLNHFFSRIELKYCTFNDPFIREKSEYVRSQVPILIVLSLSVMAAETELEIGRQRLIILLSRNHLRGPLLKMIWSIFHGCRHKKLFLFTFQTLPGKYDKSSLRVWDLGFSCSKLKLPLL